MSVVRFTSWGHANAIYSRSVIMLKLSPSLEMYLKTIHIVDRECGVVHAKDIAERLNVARPSVTGALRQLSDKKLIRYCPYESITLTPKGKSIALDIINRFEVIKRFFASVLSIEEESASVMACEMEHVIDGEAMSRLVNFIEYINTCPRGKILWDSETNGFRCASSEACQTSLCKVGCNSQQR